MTELHVPICSRCGAPLNGRDCAFCGAHLTAAPSVTAAVRDVLREDRNRNGIPDVLEAPRPPMMVAAPPRVRPLSDKVGMWIGGGIGVMTLLTFALVALLPSRVEPPVAPTPLETATATAEPTPTFTPPVVVTAAPPPSARAGAPAAPRMTNDQWGKRVVTSVSRKLKLCVEQDLLHTPGVPTAYTVTVTVGRDEMANKVVFLTKPTRGFDICGSSAITGAFVDTKIHPSTPVKEDFTFVMNIAFPDAKPATVADPTTGGWP